MTAIKCKECSKEFRPESFGEWGSYCPYCALEVCEESQVQSVSEVSNDENDPENYCQKCSATLSEFDKTHTLDSKTYCHPCIEAAGLAEFITDDFRLEETVEFGPIASLLRFVKSYLFMTTMLTLFFTGIYFLIQFSLLLGGHPERKNFIEAIKEILFFFVVIFGFWSVISLPMSLSGILNRKRKMRIENGSLFYGAGFGEKSILLEKCRWMKTNFGMDKTGCFAPFRQMITILDDQKTWIVCGHTERYRKIWAGYFNLVGLKEIRILAFRDWVKRGIYHLVIGGTLGSLFGLTLKYFSGDPEVISVCILTGFLDALVFTASSLAISRISWMMKKDKPDVRVLKWTFAFWVLGMSFGISLGVPNALYCSTINAIFGWFIGRKFNRMIQDNEAAVEVVSLENQRIDLGYRDSELTKGDASQIELEND